MELFAACARQIEGDAGNAVDLIGLIDLGIDAALLAIAQIDDLLGLAEIHPASQFSHDQDIEPLDQFALERARIGERRIADCRTQIGEQPQRVADRAIQAHGAGGVSEDFFLARAWTYARTIRLADGPDEVHREAVARLELAKNGAPLASNRTSQTPNRT